MVDGHIHALVDQHGADEVAEDLLHVGAALAPEGGSRGGGEVIRELHGPGVPARAALQQREKGLVVDAFKLALQRTVAAQLVEQLQKIFHRAVLVAGHIQRQHGQKLTGRSHIVGALYIFRHIGDHTLLQQRQIPLAVACGDAVFQLGQQLVELGSPAGGHGVGHAPQFPQEVALDMGGGGKVGVAFEKLENVGLHGIRRGAGVGPPQQREQRAAEAGARAHLPLEKLKKLPLIHLQQLKGFGHLGGHALAHAGEHHRPLTGEQAGETFGHGGSGAKPLEEGLEIRVVANGTVALQIAVLPVSPPIGAVDLAQVRRVLNMGVFRRCLGYTVVV